MEFKQPSRESLTYAIDMAYTLQRGGAGIATITDALSRAGFPEKIQRTIRVLFDPKLGEGYRPEARYQQPPSYPLD